MSFAVTGKIHEIYDTEQVSDRFKKREFVLEIQEGQYPEYVKFQTVQERTAILDGLAKGSDVTVHFDLRGRPYNRKDGTTTYFTNLNCWKVEAMQSGGAQPSAAPQGGQSGAPVSDQGSEIDGMTFSESGEDDLPF